MGPSKLPVIPDGATYVSQLRLLSEESPSKQAYVFLDKYWNRIVLSRKDVWDKSRKYATIFKRHGIEKGDIVCNTLVNSPERLLTAVGTIIAGAVSMHGQVFLADGEDFIHNCKRAKCKAVIIDPGHARGAASILKRIQYKDESTGEIRYTGLPDLTTVINVNVCSETGNAASASTSHKRGFYSIEEEHEMFEETDIKCDDTVMIFSTSGSTGFSKQCPHTHSQCLLNGRLLGYLLGLKSDQSRCYIDRHFGWIGGFPGPFFVYGATRILTDHAKGMPEKMDEHILHIINEENADCGMILPGDIELLVKSINSGKTLRKRMREFGVGGMPLTKRIFKAKGVLTDNINIGYGSTEGGYIGGLHSEKGVDFEDYCVGFPLEGVEMKIIDEAGKEVPTGTVGIVAVRSAMCALGYLNDPEKTQEAFKEDGFLVTGDNGYKEENGLFFVFGRQVQVIHRGIFMHYPGWIESRIRNCSGVENVIVIGVPDPVNHEAICACVMPSDKDNLTEKQIQDYCASLFLTETNSEMSAMPQHILLFDSFPFNQNGKLDRNILKVEALKRLQIE